MLTLHPEFVENRPDHFPECATCSLYNSRFSKLLATSFFNQYDRTQLLQFDTTCELALDNTVLISTLFLLRVQIIAQPETDVPGGIQFGKQTRANCPHFSR